jgi:hypothetical protein
VGFLALLGPLLSGLLTPIQNYFSYKQELSKASQELKLAQIAADKEVIISGNKADTDQRSLYINSISQSFRQGTFYWFSAIILYSIIFPSKAQALWNNFELIPQWVQYIYMAMLSVTWGLPIAKENIGLLFSSIGTAVAGRREFKIQKLQVINEAKVAEKLRETIFKAGMTQSQWEAVQDAIKAIK